ncbi:MAG: hypothetical protein ACP5VS_16395, partial [Desulfomonilaceae bacterium]
IMVMLIVGSPVIISQSLEAGRLSIGEVGNYNYAFFVAGQGAKIHGPSVIHHNPDILYYDHGVLSTYPHGDPAYWALGIRPVFNLKAQLNAIRGSLEQLLGGILWPTIVLFLWFVGQLRVATFVPLKFFPPSTFVMLVVICLAGTATYCLVIMEMRYIASFLFLGFAALVTALRYKPSLLDERSSILLQAVAVIAIFLVMVAHFIVDQSLRSLYNSETKVSHRETFVDMCAIKNSLEAHGIVRGDRVAVFSPINCKLYWAKIAGVRVMAEIMDVNKFLEYSPEDRKKAIDTLNKNGFKAIVVKQPRFATLGKEGWIESPGSHGYYLNFLDSQVK